ncbi:MAG: hypothetical protein JKP95_03530 [Oceanicaulis sp.]|nr:hypothetical protein [Oceanicaulis sp.]
MEWRLTDRFSLIGGARYTRDEKTFSWLNGPRMAPDLDQALAELDALGVLGLAGVSPADFGFDIVFDLSGVAGLACDNGVTVAEGVLCERSDSWMISARVWWRTSTPWTICCSLPPTPRATRRAAITASRSARALKMKM